MESTEYLACLSPLMTDALCWGDAARRIIRGLATPRIPRGGRGCDEKVVGPGSRRSSSRLQRGSRCGSEEGGVARPRAAITAASTALGTPTRVAGHGWP